MKSPTSEVELMIVQHARAQSLKEAAALDEMKKLMRATYLSQKLGTESQFEQHWPSLCAEKLRQTAAQAQRKKSAQQN